MIQLQRLEGFYWVARLGGYARAARQFPYPITQPGVHQQVRRLEEDLGVQLFERVGKDRVALTAQGQVLFEHVAPFYERLPSLEEELKAGPTRGTLRIAAGGLVLRQLLPAWLQKVRRRHPGIRLQLSEAKRADLELVRRNECELLVDWVEQLPDDLESREVGQVRAFIVVPAKHPAAKRPFRPARLTGESFIGYHEDARLRALQLRALEHLGISAPLDSTADTGEAILGFVAAGLGFSIVPSFQPRGPKVPGVAVFPLEHPSARFAIHALWRRREHPHPLIARALAELP